MQKKKILIVDDEEGFGFMVKLNLERTQRYEVRVETKGTKAVDTAKEFKPDFIFLDIVMPDIDGGDVAFQIKSVNELADIPLVFLTAAVKKEEAASRDGIIGGRPFISKPVKVDDLIEVIEKNTNIR